MSKNYFYTLTEVVSESFDIEPYTDLNVMSDDGTKVLATLTKAGELTVYPGYAWDGASPKFRIGPMIIGTWDGKWDTSIGRPELWRATLVHDVLLQIKNEHPKEMEWVTTKQIDIIFKEMLEDLNFSMAKLYYWAVRAWHKVKPSGLTLSIRRRV
tara:strand:+ start:58663 stop:59127 length:465 start_codon:yes stop_codon:yes gene_type:complete